MQNFQPQLVSVDMSANAPQSSSVSPLAPWQPGDVVPAPLNIYSCLVEQEWVDYNGHMTEAAYLSAFGWGSDALFTYIGDNDADAYAGAANTGAGAENTGTASGATAASTGGTDAGAASTGGAASAAPPAPPAPPAAAVVDDEPLSAIAKRTRPKVAALTAAEPAKKDGAEAGEPNTPAEAPAKLPGVTRLS